ncbi:MAG: tetratricopeptide repeat protein [Tepidisphaeraceae bacterium]
MSVIIHATNVVLLYLFLARATGSTWPAAFVAMTFALHPLRVESVAWVAERKDVLSGLLFLLCVHAYAWYVSRRGAGPWRSMLVALLFALGLMAKPMLVTAPAVLLMLDYWPLGRAGGMGTSARRWSRLAWEKMPLAALAVVSCVVTFVAQQQGGSVASVERVTIGARFANALVAYGRYVLKTVWPTDLAVFYPHPGMPPTLHIAASLALLAGVSFIAWWLRRRAPYLIVGWLWFLVMLLPVIGLVQVGRQAMADRYTYLPGIGLGIMAAWGIGDLAVVVWRARSRRGALAAFAVAVGVVMFVLTREQVLTWRDNLTLFSHALEVTRDNYLAHGHVGSDLSALRRTDEAESHLRRALELRPDYPEAHYNLANLLAGRGDVGDAIAHYHQAITLDPGLAGAYNNYGRLLVATGRIAEAIDLFGRAVEVDPQHVESRTNLATALLMRGDVDEAVAHYRRALSMRPDFELARRGLAKALQAASTRPAAP